MLVFEPPWWITTAFVLLTSLVATMAVGLVAATYRIAGQRPPLVRSMLAVLAWMILHAGIVLSGLLQARWVIPPVVPVIVASGLVAMWVALGPIGHRLRTLPMAVLAAAQFFRLPLELILHGLAVHGSLPEVMTWEGYNFDVVTGGLAVVIALVTPFRRIGKGLFWLFNIVGLALLVTVVSLALLSAPLPIRVFTEGPPNVLPYFLPYTWIVSVHVFSALVLHLVSFRALIWGSKS